MSDLWSRSAEQLAQSVRAGELSALEVTEACLDRIGLREPEVGALVDLDPEGARDRAERLDRRRFEGESLGPLAGVPVVLKDNLAMRGRPLHCGSRILEGAVSPYTATAVSRLIDADAVVVGRSNMDEFGMGSSCEHSALGSTRNPWSSSVVPGGSSGGSAAAVAAGEVPLALGSDTGGSVRQPAAFCGVVGLRPTWGRVSRRGLVAFSSSLDQIGPLCRGVRDAALTLGVIGGVDEGDATSSGKPMPNYLEAIEGGLQGLRVGLVSELDPEELAIDARREWARVLGRLEDAGLEPRSVSIPDLGLALPAYHVLANCEASSNLARFDGVRYGRRASGAEHFEETIVESRSRGLGREVQRRILLGTFALTASRRERFYERAVSVARSLSRQFDAAFEEVDVLLLPTTPGGAFELGERDDDPLAMYGSDRYTTPASLAGLPAVAVPSGLDDRGLPLSIQILGRAFDEGRVLRAARGLEQLLGFDARPAEHFGGER